MIVHGGVKDFNLIFSYGGDLENIASQPHRENIFTSVWNPLTCDDKRVGNRGLREHALYVAGEKLESLSAPALRIHQHHDSARPTHLHIRHTWERQRKVDVSEGEDRDEGVGFLKNV